MSVCVYICGDCQNWNKNWFLRHFLYNIQLCDTLDNGQHLSALKRCPNHSRASYHRSWMCWWCGPSCWQLWRNANNTKPYKQKENLFHFIYQETDFYQFITEWGSTNFKYRGSILIPNSHAKVEVEFTTQATAARNKFFQSKALWSRRFRLSLLYSCER